MLVKCPSCNTEYDCEPGRYRCVCGAEFTAEPESPSSAMPPDIGLTIRPRQNHAPQAGSGALSDIDLTIAPRRAQPHPSQEASDVTMPGRHERKPDGRFAAGDLILGRYKVLSELGQGGMGVVYRCFDETAGIEIALKTLPPELSHNTLEMNDVRANFRLVSRLVHQNIAIYRNLERDATTGNCYLIMECVSGEDLRNWIRRKREEGSLTLRTVLPVIRQVASALDYAHEEKVIHRDIKPGNIMINTEGHVKVLDFGLAAQIQTSMTRVSMVSQDTGGTAPYMAPEQWRGKVQGAAADQYALAVMTYEMLAGHLPFESTDVTVLREAVLNETPDPIESLPKFVQTAIEHAMSKDPSKRFRTCSDFIAALDGKAVEPAAAGPAAGSISATGNAVATRSPAPGDAANDARIIRRISILMEQKEWGKAVSYCEKLLESDPENAGLYLMMCMASCHIPNEDALKRAGQNLAYDKNFQMALKFASPERQKELTQIQYLQADHILEQLKAKYKVQELIHTPAPLGTDESFRIAVANASPELKTELLNTQKKQSEFWLNQCMAAHRVSNEAQLADCDAPLTEDAYFGLALQCASPERREQLQKLLATQSELFLQKCMKKHHVSKPSKLAHVKKPLLLEDPYFRKAMTCASAKIRSQLQEIANNQTKYLNSSGLKFLKCVKAGALTGLLGGLILSLVAVPNIRNTSRVESVGVFFACVFGCVFWGTVIGLLCGIISLFKKMANH